MQRPWKVLLVVSVAVFMASLDLFIVNVAFPDIGRDFSGASEASLSWVLNAYAIVFAALLVPAGRLADRYGRRRAFLAGCAGFVLGSALCGLAPSLPVLVGARVLQAAGAAVLMPTSLALLLPEFPPERRPLAIGVWAAVSGVAAALGPPVGGLLVELDWRLVFLVNLPIGIGAIGVARGLLREHRDESGALPDLLGSVVLVAAVSLLALAIVEAPDWGWTGAATLGCLAAAAVGLGWFAARCRSHPSPVVDPAIVRVRSFALANVAMLLFGVGFAAMLLQLVLYLTSAWGSSVLLTGVSIAPGPVMAAALGVPAGQLARRVGPHRVATVGMLVFAAGCGWWAWRMEAEPNFLGALLPGMLLTGIGVGLTLAPLSAAATASLPPARLATGVGLFTMARQLGSALGVAALIAVGSLDDGWWVLILPALAGAAAASAIGRVEHAAPATVPAPAR